MFTSISSSSSSSWSPQLCWWGASPKCLRPFRNAVSQSQWDLPPFNHNYHQRHHHHHHYHDCHNHHHRYCQRLWLWLSWSRPWPWPTCIFANVSPSSFAFVVTFRPSAVTSCSWFHKQQKSHKNKIKTISDDFQFDHSWKGSSSLNVMLEVLTFLSDLIVTWKIIGQSDKMPKIFHNNRHLLSFIWDHLKKKILLQWGTKLPC